MNSRYDENVNKPALKKSKTVDENLDKLSSDFGIILLIFLSVQNSKVDFVINKVALLAFLKKSLMKIIN